jgi:hypothetical protein
MAGDFDDKMTLIPIWAVKFLSLAYLQTPQARAESLI